MRAAANPSAARAWAAAALALALALGAVPGRGAADAPFDQVVRAAAAGAGPELWGEALLEREEPHTGAPGGARLVRYHAKGRLELAAPGAGVDGVTHGRLVHELIGGDLAVGDGLARRYAGAEIPVVGDRDRAANPAAPTYRSLAWLRGRVVSAVGRPVDTVLVAPEGAGVLHAAVVGAPDPALGQLAREAVYLDDAGHHVPDVFWAALTRLGAPGGRALTWTALVGLPLTDAFWVRARAGGRPVDALVQPFERRTLIYTPGAPAGARVTVGDAGRDYLAWRDGRSNPAPDLTPPPTTNGWVSPAVAEAGSWFLMIGTGFRPGEAGDAWIESGGTVWPLGIPLQPGGVFGVWVRTWAAWSGPEVIRVVARGRESGHTSVLQARVVATDTPTPGAEAAAGEAVPAGERATLAPAFLRVGEIGELRAEGFAPGERVTAWVTTGLQRVIPYADHLATVRWPPGEGRPAAVAADLRADADGRLVAGLPAPGLAGPGVYALTLAGDDSRARAVAYFRAGAGAPLQTWIGYGEAPAPAGAAGGGPGDRARPAVEPVAADALAALARGGPPAARPGGGG